MLAPITDPDAFVAARTWWHTLAERVLAPARHAASGRIGLRQAPGGFATPPFGSDDRVVAVDGPDLSVSDRHGLRRGPSGGTLGQVAAFVGVPPDADTGLYTPTTPADPDTRFDGDPEVLSGLAQWFEVGQTALGRWRAGHVDDTPSEIQLWPEHFDLALDLGPEGGRANYGFSPGDEGHTLPYAYVGPWEPTDDPFWNAGSYARLGYDALAAERDPAAAALAFFAAGYAVVTGRPHA
jgi:hypothetical protein